jgi:serine protease Do
MYEGQQKNGCRFAAVVAVMILSVLLGITGGAIAGGFAGYTAASNRAAPAVTIPQPVATSPATYLTLTQDSALISAVERVKPAVVTVINTLPPQRGFFGQIVEPQASGSGVIISSDGYLVTNNHVVENSQSLEVIYSDDSKVPATLVGADAVSDLAVLRVAGPIPATAELGDSTSLQTGEPVIAIGSPLGSFKGTVTVGVVSALDRRLDVGGSLVMEGLIQTDAAINQGNSGGPLVNAVGQVVGINTAIVRGSGAGGAVAEGLGFAIPSSAVREVATQLIEFGKVRRPYLGIEWVAITPRIASAYNLPAEYGAYVQAVQAGGPADQAGLRAGDIITAIGDHVIDEQNSMLTILMRFEPEERVEITFVREGREMTLKMTLGSS